MSVSVYKVLTDKLLLNKLACFLHQRSISFRTEARPMPPMPIRTRQKASSFPRRRSSQLWSDTVDSLSQDLSAKEIKRQEVRRGITRT